VQVHSPVDCWKASNVKVNFSINTGPSVEHVFLIKMFIVDNLLRAMNTCDLGVTCFSAS
jgi:hypothetical protein